MTDLIAAILAAYKANVTLMGLTPGGIFQGLSNSATFDYVTLSIITNAGGEPTYGDHQLGEVVVSFSVWSVQAGAVASATAKSIRDAFKNNLLALAEGKILNVQVARSPLVMPQRSRNEAGKSVVLVSFDLRYSVEMF